MSAPRSLRGPRPGRVSARLAVLVAVALVGVLGLSVSAARASALRRAPMALGFVDDPLFFDSSGTTRDAWLSQAQALGSTVIRLPVYWAQVAPAFRAPGFDAANPSDPQYDFSAVDSAVVAAAAHHQRIMLMIRQAPQWAERSDLPAGFAYNGAWWPDAGAFGQFAHAVALRYSGHFANPAQRGGVLPAVRYLQAWNEPNLPDYLSPQWGRARNGRIVPLAPAIYRDMLNAFHAGVKSAVPGDQVFAAATAPYGDPPGTGQQRMRPVTFLDELFCLSASLRAKACPDPPHLDGLDHHPYSLSPSLPARNPGDISVADLGKIARILAAAARAHHVIPAGPKPLWVTELDWSDVRPLNPARQARALAEGFYELWRQGVSVALWFQLRDPPGVHNSFLGSGLYAMGGRAKPAAAAYRFPFCAVPLGHGAWAIWGRAPRGGRVVVQVRAGHRWRPIVTLHTGAGNYFFARRSLARGNVLRAVMHGATSPVWDTIGPY